MPKKTKDIKDEEINKKVKSTTTKKNTKSSMAKNVVKSTSKADKAKKSTSGKKNTETKKKSSSTPTSRKGTTKKSTTKKKQVIDSVEYYDLPDNYNKTVIKILAQTPKTLFIYWDISKDDINNFKKQYGDNFFETTKPVLIVHNDSINYSFEVEINDFANSWYLHVNDAKCDYIIELSRKPISNISNIKEEYIYITSSNEIESPNDKILFDKSKNIAFFRNVKTNIETKKDISTISFIRNIGKIYNIYDLYKEMYKEDIDELTNLSNPSSNSFSSKFM